MEPDQDTRTSSDELWKAVMRNDQAVAGNAQVKKWRVVNNRTAACDACKDTGASVLIRCAHEKCPREYHLDCAFHHGGLLMDDSGSVSVFCDAHFKPILFCTCKEVYNELRPMIFCDECCDWFHNSCEGIHGPVSESQSYVCKSCREISKQGRTVSKVLKEKNSAKEMRSLFQQNATKAIGLLSELEGGLCPIIDEITRSGRSQYTIKEVSDAKDVLSSPPFGTRPGVEDPSTELLVQLGVMPVIDKWQGVLNTYLDSYELWFNRANQYVNENNNRIVTQFSADQLPIIREVCVQLRELGNQAKQEMVGVPADLDGYFAYCDAVIWMQEFLEILHQDPKADNWNQTIGASLRTGAQRYKQMAAFSKDPFCGAFLEFFQSYHKSAAQQLSAMNAWYNETYKILHTQADYSLVDLQAFLDSADEFPARPLLYEELRDIVTNGWALNEEIVAALDKSAMEEAALEELNRKMDDLGVTLPCEDKLAAVGRRMIFTKACALALSEPRTQADVVAGLIAQAQELLRAESPKAAGRSKSSAVAAAKTSEADLYCGLYDALGDEINGAVTQLQGLLDEVAAVTSSLVLKAGVDVDFAVLERLRGLKVIAAEEELLDFLQRTSAILADAERTLSSAAQPSSAQHVSLNALQQLSDQVEEVLKETVVERFDVGQQRKVALNKVHSELVDLEVRAEKLWAVVAGAVADCERGAAPSLEELRAAIDAAEGTGVRDDEQIARTERLIAEANQVEQSCLAELETLHNAEEDTVHRARALLERSQHFPLSAARARTIAQRATVCGAVRESQRFLAMPSAAIDLAHFDREMHTLRDLRATIEQLSRAGLVDVENSLLENVREAILLFHWRCEVRFMWVHAVTPTAAQDIHRHGQELGDAAVSTQVWADLGAEMLASETFQKEARSALEEVEASKSLTSEAWMAVGTKLAERLRALQHTDAQLRIRNPALTQSLHETAELLNVVLTGQDKITRAQEVMLSSGTAIVPVMDFREVTALVNQLTLAGEKHSTFALLKNLTERMSFVHSAAANWNERALSLLPQKATRNKTKGDAAQVTVDDLLAALAEPIARAVLTPMHEKLQATLAQADAFRAQVLSFLLPSEVPFGDTINYQSPEFLDKLHADIAAIAEIRKVGESIPVDLPEMRVINWVSALFEWMAHIPYPGDDPRQDAIPLDEALRKVEESQPIVGTIPGNVIETLCRLGVMNLNPDQGPVGFHKSIHPSLNLAGDLCDHLEKQVKQCKELQEQLNLTADTRRPSLEALQKIQEGFAALLVHPSPHFRRLLDRAMGKSASRASTVAGLRHREEVSETSSSEYSGEEDEGEEEGEPAYWRTSRTERTETPARSKAAATGKRAREGGDSLLSLPATKRPAAVDTKVKAEEKVKKSKICANPQCPTKATKLKNSTYCSNTCAFVAAPTALNALLAYRKLLCIFGAVKEKHIQAEDPSQNLLKVSPQDWRAYALNAPPIQEAMAEIVAGMKNAGMIAETYVSGRPHSRPGDRLDSFLLDAARRSESLQQTIPPTAAAGDPSSPRVKTEGAGGEKKYHYLQSMLLTLPPAAGPVLLKGDSEGLASHAAAVKALGSTPVPVPAPKQPIAGSGAGGAGDEDLRQKVRYGLEELLERTLTRLQVPGAVCHAAFIALEFEEELCLKYASAESKASRKAIVFDKKEYRKHYLMLVSNLRKSHNDALILKLVSQELSFDTLLEMTAVQLADASTQQKRQQQLTNVVNDALRESTQETLEKARREVMAGTDAVSTDLAARAAAAVLQPSFEEPVLSRESSTAMEVDMPPSIGRTDSEDTAETGNDMDDGMDAPHEEAASSRSLEIEQRVSAAAADAPSPRAGAGHIPKRPMDADAISRFTTSSARPNKVPRLETDESVVSSATSAAEACTPRSTVVKESPRVKPPSVLSSILSNKAAVAAAAASPHDASSSGVFFEDVVAAPAKSPLQGAVDAVKLINSSGGHELSIVRPSHGSGGKSITMKGEAWMIDRQLQGIVRSPCNIDGRVKLEEFQRIVNKIMTMRNDPRSANLPTKKHIAVFKMAVQGGDRPGTPAGDSYKNFCSEFSRDNRVALSNLSGGAAQLYIVPPQLQDCLPLFMTLDGVDTSASGSTAILYGLITSKETGPGKYVNADASAVMEGGFSLEEPAFDFTSSGSAGIAAAGSSSSSSAKAVLPPPPAPPKLPKTSSTGPTVPAPPRPPAVPVPVSAASTAAIPGPPVPPPKPPTTIAAAPAAPAASAPKPAEDPIQRVANFVAARGVQMIRDLQAKPETRTVMPFLFEGHPDNPRFLQVLKDALAAKNAAK